MTGAKSVSSRNPRSGASAGAATTGTSMVMMVRPSAGCLRTSAIANVESAPGRFSTLIRQLWLSDSSVATMRLITSGGLPAAPAVTMRRLLTDWALASSTPARIPRTTRNARDETRAVVIKIAPNNRSSKSRLKAAPDFYSNQILFCADDMSKLLWIGDAVEGSHRPPAQATGHAHPAGRGGVWKHGKSRRASCHLSAGGIAGNRQPGTNTGRAAA